MNITVEQVEAAVKKYNEETENRWGKPFFNDIEGHDGVKLGDLGTAEFVENFGGEGQGDTLWIVFRLGDQTFRVTGRWESWDGADWDYPVFDEVLTYKVTRKEFLSQSEADNMRKSKNVEVEL